MRGTVIYLLTLVVGTVSCSPVPRPSEEASVPTAAQCAAVGAFLDQRGLFGKPMCVRRFSDAGKVCSDKSDCIGRCIIEDKGQLQSLAIDTGTTGQCQADDRLFGCYAEIVNGRVTERVCVD